MALINCPDCQAKISDSAHSCLSCGRPMSAKVIKHERAEIVYLSDNTVHITSTRAVLSGKTFTMANISSVSTGIRSPYTALGGFLFLLGLPALSIVAIKTYGTESPAISQSSETLRLVLLAFSLVMLVSGLAIGTYRQYVVEVGSSSGETDVIFSNDKRYIDDIVNAMNQAILERG